MNSKKKEKLDEINKTTTYYLGSLEGEFGVPRDFEVKLAIDRPRDIYYDNLIAKAEELSESGISKYRKNAAMDFAILKEFGKYVTNEVSTLFGLATRDHFEDNIAYFSNKTLNSIKSPRNETYRNLVKILKTK